MINSIFYLSILVCVGKYLPTYAVYSVYTKPCNTLFNDMHINVFKCACFNLLQLLSV